MWHGVIPIGALYLEPYATTKWHVMIRSDREPRGCFTYMPRTRCNRVRIAMCWGSTCHCAGLAPSIFIAWDVFFSQSRFNCSPVGRKSSVHDCTNVVARGCQQLRRIVTPGRIEEQVALPHPDEPKKGEMPRGVPSSTSLKAVSRPSLNRGCRRCRFGLWDDIIAEPRNEDPSLYPTSLTAAHYARGIAFASKGLVAEAEEEQVCKACDNRRSSQYSTQQPGQAPGFLKTERVLCVRVCDIGKARYGRESWGDAVVVCLSINVSLALFCCCHPLGPAITC